MYDRLAVQEVVFRLTVGTEIPWGNATIELAVREHDVSDRVLRRTAHPDAPRGGPDAYMIERRVLRLLDED